MTCPAGGSSFSGSEPVRAVSKPGPKDYWQNLRRRTGSSGCLSCMWTGTGLDPVSCSPGLKLHSCWVRGSGLKNDTGPCFLSELTFSLKNQHGRLTWRSSDDANRGANWTQMVPVLMVPHVRDPTEHQGSEPAT